MPDRQPMSAAEFVERRGELPEGGRWHELHAGHPVLLDAPDDSHGTIVLNLSRELARWLPTQGPAYAGYACHDVGLLVHRNPDTIYVPALSFFDVGPRFSQTDQIVASQVPRLVVDIASSNDRRREMRLRTQAYLELGVDLIWVPDPFKKEVQVLRRGLPMLALGTWQQLEGGVLLPGFQIEVKQVFAQPAWWTSSAPRKEQ